MLDRNNAAMVCLALVAGFVGGKVGGRVPTSAAAEERVVRATRFELTDSAGLVLGVWGGGVDRATAIRFIDPKGKVLGSFGIGSDGLPFLHAFGPDGINRFALQFIGPEANPQLVLSDTKWEGRVLLGNYFGGDAPPKGSKSWGLKFAGPEHMSGFAGIGMFENPQTRRLAGEVFTYDEAGRRRVFPSSAVR